MTYYNYHIQYDNGSYTELLRCDRAFEFDTTAPFLKIQSKNKQFVINLSHVTYIKQTEIEESEQHDS